MSAAIVRAKCPTCGSVDMPTENVKLRLRDAGDVGTYAFTCPGCSAVVEKYADSRIVGLLREAGAEVVPLTAGSAWDHVHVGQPALTVDDLLDMHEALKDDEAIRRELGL